MAPSLDTIQEAMLPLLDHTTCEGSFNKILDMDTRLEGNGSPGVDRQETCEPGRNYDQRATRERDSETDEDILEPIAIVGLSVKFPGQATSAGAFWDMMMERKCASKIFPPDRMNIDAFYHPNPQKLNRVSPPCASCVSPS